jgi:hypothetical protein
MPESLDWRQMMAEHARLLEQRTGAGVDQWLARIRTEGPPDEAALRAWLAGQGVTGYPQQLLVFETFGYPPFLTATSGELIEAQYADRPGGLRGAADPTPEVRRRQGGHEDPGRSRPAHQHQAGWPPVHSDTPRAQQRHDLENRAGLAGRRRC